MNILCYTVKIKSNISHICYNLLYNNNFIKDGFSSWIKKISRIFYINVIYHIIYTEYYMSKSVSHAVSTRKHYLIPRATVQRADIGRGLIRHVIQILTCNVHYIIYFNHAFDITCI